MNSILQQFISYEIQILLKEDKRSEMISKLRREAIENGNMMWFVNKFDHRLPNDETRAAIIEFGTAREAYQYGMYVDKSPRDDTRSAALSDPYYAYYYALSVDKSPRDDTRDAAWKVPQWGREYDKYFDNEKEIK